MCVDGGEIYSSKIYIGDSGNIVAATIDGKGNVIETTTHFNGLEKNFDYDKNNIKWAAKNFYTNWIEDLSSKEILYQTIRADGKRIVSPDYTNPTYIEIKDKKSMAYRYLGDTKDREAGKEDGGLLYVPGDGKICFFSTNRVTSYDVDGIDNNFLRVSDSQYVGKNIPFCSTSP